MDNNFISRLLGIVCMMGIVITCQGNITLGQEFRIYENDNPPNEAPVRVPQKRIGDPIITLYTQSTDSSSNVLRMGMKYDLGYNDGDYLWQIEGTTHEGLLDYGQGIYSIQNINIPFDGDVETVNLYKDNGNGVVDTGDTLKDFCYLEGIKNSEYSYSKFILQQTYILGELDNLYFASNFLKYFMCDSSGEREWYNYDFEEKNGPLIYTTTVQNSWDKLLTHVNSIPFIPFFYPPVPEASIHLVKFPNGSKLTQDIGTSEQIQKTILNRWFDWEVKYWIQEMIPPGSDDSSLVVLELPSHLQHLELALVKIDFIKYIDDDLFYAIGTIQIKEPLKIKEIWILPTRIDSDTSRYMILNFTLDGVLWDLYDFDRNLAGMSWYGANLQIGQNEYKERLWGTIFRTEIDMASNFSIRGKYLHLYTWEASL